MGSGKFRRGNDLSLRNIEVDSIPSDIEGDEWNEIVKYEKERFEEEK